MATPPDFTTGAVLTAAQMSAIGLWRITPTVSGTGVTVASDGSVTLTAAPDPFITAFSADFRNYRIFTTITAFGGGSAAVVMRVASGTTPNTTAANYKNVGGETAYGGASVSVVTNNGASAFWNVGRVDGSLQFGSIITDVMNPFASTYSSFNSTFRDGGFSGYQDGLVTVTTSYNGFNIRTNGTNTLTGTIDVFGFN
jgi:hypothetical protein